MDVSPDVQKQLDEQKKQCIFCKIVKGEVASKKVFENDSIIAVLDISPAVKGHTLVMPKEHYPILPYVPQDVFYEVFGVLPELVSAVKESLICFGSTIFLANGGVAGQQSPHFLFHIFPREKGDGLEKYDFSGDKHIDAGKVDEGVKALSYTVPLLMRKFFGQFPASWHSGSGSTPPFLEDIRKGGSVVYEDEKLLCMAPQKPQSIGHIVIYSKEEEKLFENLSSDSATHLFRVASFGASASFDSLQAHGTNIIMKSGKSGDNPDECLSLHVIPRWQNDGLDLLWSPKQGLNDGDVSDKIRDKTFFIGKKKEKPNIVVVEEKNEERVSEVSISKSQVSYPESRISSPESNKSDAERIEEAIQRMW